MLTSILFSCVCSQQHEQNFQNITIGPDSDLTRPGVVTAESERTVLIFEDVKFRNNNFTEPEIHVSRLIFD